MNETTPPTVVTKVLTVQCPRKLAFRVWTAEIDLWWPKSHSLSGDPKTEVVLENHVGGRFYERTPTGVEYAWGEILTWDPPHHLAFTWHLGTSPQQPSQVDVHFFVAGANQTRIELNHRGPELIGELWSTRSVRFATGWEAVFAAWKAYLPSDSDH